MHSPAAALAWEFWGRYRWELTAFGVFALAYAVATATITPADPEKFAALGSFVFAMGLLHLVVVFSHGAEVRVETAESGFPARAFALPVRTSVLVGWPMLQAAAAAVLAWVVWDRFVLRPCGVETPFWWAPMLAALVVAVQALVWVPVGLPWLRLPVAVIVLTGLVRAPALLALAGERFTDPAVENAILSLFAAVVIPVAFLLARAGVSRARRGDSPDWWRAVRSPGRADAAYRERPPFASAMRALVWYEWRLRAHGFPVLVVFTVAALMASAVLLVDDDGGRTGFSATFLIIPFVLAAFCGSFLGATGDSHRSWVVIPAFAATRPVSNAAVVAAKVTAAALAAAVAWAAALALTAGWLAFTGGVRDLPRAWDQAAAHLGPVRAAALAAVLAVGPAVLIWRILIGDIWVMLTGRPWVSHAQAVVLVPLASLAAHEWSLGKDDPARYARVADALPWVAAAAAAVKVLVAVWLLRLLVRRGEITGRTVGWLVGGWVLAAAGLFALLAWLAPPGLVPAYALAAGVVLFVPLARPALAPLALAWNRHR
ncbi:MAG TPA: hypothetical protein VH092_05375 [Urbifossiella sp.]|jgi:hypothetical protein|nr:hypothetical protein [Urbifossiella sp.]